MTATLETPRELVESVADVRLPTKADARLQSLMSRNTEGELAPHEREELESLVELSEMLSLMRAGALFVLGKKPT